MNLQKRYIWIWQLNNSEGGDITRLINMARTLGIDGYIIKAHDGASVWSQADAIAKFKNAGLSCGAWGYWYGRDIMGEVEAVKKVAALKPDFYVADVESEFEPQGMRSVAEQMLKSIGKPGIPFGYTSFAIPKLHSVPFDIFSRYCDFTMPQVYWAEMKWNMRYALTTSYQQYKGFSIPVYPIGQISSDVNPQDILAFDQLCESMSISTVSYWDYQSAGTNQLNALKSLTPPPPTPLSDAVKVLADNGIINTPEYWNNNAVSGKTVDGGYAATLIIRMADKLTNKPFSA